MVLLLILGIMVALWAAMLVNMVEQSDEEEALYNVQKWKELLDEHDPILTPTHRGYESPNKDLHLAVDIGWPEMIDEVHEYPIEYAYKFFGIEDSKGGETNENLGVRGEEPEDEPVN